MPAAVSLGRKGWQNCCSECGIGPYEPGKHRDPDYREYVRQRLEAVAQAHNRTHHAHCEG